EDSYLLERLRTRVLDRVTDVLDNRPAALLGGLWGYPARAPSRASSASICAKPAFAPSSTPYCIVGAASSVGAKRIVWVSFDRSPRPPTASLPRWFWKVCTSR